MTGGHEPSLPVHGQTSKPHKNVYICYLQV